MDRESWYRPRNVVLGALVAVVLFLAWGLYETLEVYRSRPNPAVDSRRELRDLFESRSGVSPAEAEAAWVLLSRILDDADAVDAEVNTLIADGVFGPVDENTIQLDYGRVTGSRLSADDLEAERRAIRLLVERGVFDRLAAFAAGPPALHPIDGQVPLEIGAQGLLNDLGRLRELARARVASMRLAAVEGNLEETALAFDQTLALARSVSWQPFLLGALTGCAIEALATTELRRLLLEHDVDEATCRRLLESFDRQETNPHAGYTVEAERIFAHDWIQWSYSDDGSGGGYQVASPAAAGMPTAPPPRQSIVGSFASRFVWPGRRSVASAVDEVADRVIAASRMSPSQRAEALAEIERQRRDESSDVVLSPAAAVPVQSALARDVVTEGTRVMVLLALYRAVHGRYPESLADLAPEFVPEPPHDPLHGLPFGYRLLDDDPDGRPYLLYAIGLDATDDGGAPPAHADGPDVLRDPSVRGDSVLNRPRPDGR